MDSRAEVPLARSHRLLVEELGDELLVYDLESDRAHSLSPDAARVWARCDGETGVEALSAELGLDSGTVGRALDELAACELLDTVTDPVTGSTRREVTVKLVQAGAAVAAAPLILSVTAPAAHAQVTPGFCAQFSGPDCGAGDPSGGCKAAGCCCCTPPVSGGNFICADTIANCPSGTQNCEGPESTSTSTEIQKQTTTETEQSPSILSEPSTTPTPTTTTTPTPTTTTPTTPTTTTPTEIP